MCLQALFNFVRLSALISIMSVLAPTPFNEIPKQELLTGQNPCISAVNVVFHFGND